MDMLMPFLAGLVIGLLLMFVLNRWRGGAADPATVKREYDQYRERVESHFQLSGEKFKILSAQYQDLYEHLAQGAHDFSAGQAAQLLSEVDAEKIASKPLQESQSGSPKDSSNDSDNDAEPDPNNAAESNAPADQDLDEMPDKAGSDHKLEAGKS